MTCHLLGGEGIKDYSLLSRIFTSKVGNNLRFDLISDDKFTLNHF